MTLVDAPDTVTKAALVVAHPGHELRVFGWLEQVQPLVCVLTDGSGGAGASRIDATTRVLDSTAARPGPVYGRLADRSMYSAVLALDFGFFARLVDELTEASAPRNRLTGMRGT